jgi:hypothetical protein
MRYLAHDLGDLESAYIIPFSDLHIGDPLFDEKKFLGYRDWVLKQPNAFVTVNGDIINAALPDSVSDSMEEAFNPKEQVKRAREIFRPLFEANRVLCWNDGNHEYRIRRRTALDVGEMICEKFDAEHLYTQDGAVLKLTLGKGENGKRICYVAYITHGTGGGKRPGGKVNTVQDLQRVVVADIYVEGHVHMPAVFTQSIFVPDLYNNQVREVKQTFVCGGSFLRWGGYSERKGYSPARTGCPRIRLEGRGRKDVHCSI